MACLLLKTQNKHVDLELSLGLVQLKLFQPGVPSIDAGISMTVSVSVLITLYWAHVLPLVYKLERGGPVDNRPSTEV